MDEETPSLSGSPGTWRATADELRLSVIRGGLQLLAREGLALGAERISIERAAAEARVSRASAYRLWSDLPVRPQDAFQVELLCFIGEHNSSGSDEELEVTERAIFGALNRFGPFEQVPREQRGRVLVEVIKAGAAANLAALRGSENWRLYSGVLASASSRLGSGDDLPHGHHELVDSLKVGAQEAATRYVPMYQALIALFGLRLREGYTIEQFATVAGCLVEGVALREPFTSHVTGISGPYDGLDDWDLFGVGFLGIVREFLEADPLSDSPTDLP